MQNKTTFLRANLAFRDRDFYSAAALYKVALQQAVEPLQSQIKFNYKLALQRLGHNVHAAVLTKPEGLDDYYFELIRESGLFDPIWYLEQYQTEYHINANPLAHYLAHGVELSTNPSPGFETAYYLKSNQDVAEAGIHPFIHYLSQGHKENRAPKAQYADNELDVYHVEPSQYIQRLDPNSPLPNKAARVIAFYLPQFHPIPENDKWWGEGFTEWSNVRPAKPQFEGHYQPHVPDEFLGYYDLRDTSVMRKQIELAKQYGVEGFCFYAYWFSGHRLLETPVDNFLNDPTLDLPFCICWANENWSRKWNGLDQDLLLTQEYSDDDDIAFISHMSKYLRDSRYIKIEGKPLLVVYRPNLLPSMAATAKRWRKWCSENGIGDIYLAYVQSFEKADPKKYGLDAAIEFPPNNSSPVDVTREVRDVTSSFKGIVYDLQSIFCHRDLLQQESYTKFLGVCPSWDNTPRRGDDATIFVNENPSSFEKQLTRKIIETNQRVESHEKRLVFINAWNEWGEGCHLEPDQRYGYAWLSAIRNSHENVVAFQKNELKDKTLLFVDYAVPMYDRFAGSRTNYNYLLLLIKMGMKIIYLPADFKAVEPYTTELNVLGVEVLTGDWIKKNYQDWFKLNGRSIDFAFLHKPNPAIQFLDLILKNTNAPIIYQCHDLHYLRLQRQAQLANDDTLLDESKFYREKESYLFSTCDALLTFSTVEKNIIKEEFLNNRVYTVPLFFYDSLPKQKHDFINRKDLLYVGGFDHAPNRDAVLWFCHEVLPLVLLQIPNIVLNVVGANPPSEIARLNSKNIKIHGKLSDEELEILYNSVRLSVVPLRVGAGVKGKVIEALYHAVPLVSTSVGLEGISDVEQLTESKDNPEDFALEVLNLYLNKNLWLKQSALQAKFVAERFTFQIAEAQMRRIFTEAKESRTKRLESKGNNTDQFPLRTIAFHLPQYHPIPENDEWWGKGFTEWRNVCKATPLFPGHYQPHISTDLGFYDLRSFESRIAQSDLAREYGIDGFCYYHYWFNGKRLLERPVEEILASGKPDFPFCLCWANENWTKRWDGQDNDILIRQIYSEEDDRAHIQDLFRFFRDPRYIRVNGKPLFLVYRTENMPDPIKTTKIWREEARNAGIGELYLLRVESLGRINPIDIGFDAALEFAPDWGEMKSEISSYNIEESGYIETVDLPEEVCKNNYIRSYPQLMSRMLKKEQPSYPWFRCVTPSWDNSARRKEGSVILLGSTPKVYQQWVENIVEKTIDYNRPEERIVFINAWNEWAEGNHLEPCLKWGRSYLEATKLGISNGLSANVTKCNPMGKLATRNDQLDLDDNSHSIDKILFEHIELRQSPKSLIISCEDFYDIGNQTYLKGWATINDDQSTEGTEIFILVHSPNGEIRTIKPSMRKRPEITAHFGGQKNYDLSGFEVMTSIIKSDEKITFFIKRSGEYFWQDFR